MCPPASVTAPAIELDKYWTDEVVCKSLVQFKSGCPLPLNVLHDVDPYQCMPSNLAENMWYFCSGTKKDAEHGFWMSTGEACEIYSTSVFTGLRKTLQFYEGRAPSGQKTNWMMQEYTTTDKYNNKLDCRALCRVFLVDDKSGGGKVSESELLEKNMEDRTGPSAMVNTSPDPPSATADTSPDQPSAMADTSPDQPSAMANRSPDWPPENLADRDYVLMGDYLELDDLAVSISHSSSSADSSCMTMTSEEFFDPVALMRELGDDIVEQEVQDSSVKLNLSAPTKSKEVVMNPTTLAGFCEDGKECKPLITQTSKTDDTPDKEAGDDRNSNGMNTTASSSSSEEKKDRGGGRTKKRKVMKYLCFLAF